MTSLDGRIDSANVPLLLEGLVREVLWYEFDLDDHAALVRAATAIVRAA